MDISDRHLLYKIVCARDKRYDGRFYCGVHTTGIYCRPICPAKPNFENISFYRSATEAEKAGNRACLRCRPDLAPSSVQWGGTSALVGRALNMITRGDADDISLEEFAGKLGVSDRHLRRLFDLHVGASPIEVAGSKRLHLARQLLSQSSLSVTEIAFASGYRSIRRFNEAFKERFQASPRSFCRSKGPVVSDRSSLIHIKIPIIAPFNWASIFEFLKNHGIHGLESFENGRYRRCFSIEKTRGAIEVGYEPKRGQLFAKIAISNPVYLREVIERVRDLFDTRMNPHAHLNDFNSKDPIAACYLGELGLRVPGSWDPFETAICIILGQLVSVKQARSNVRKLVEEFGTKLSDPVFLECHYLFPNPQSLLEGNFKNIGITQLRGEAIRELSRQVLEKRIDLSRTSDIEKTKAQLLTIKGIGPWTTEMIAMRCLGDANAFPRTDLIIKRTLDQHQKSKGDWSPWNAYIALALWKKHTTSLSRKTQKLFKSKS